MAGEFLKGEVPTLKVSYLILSLKSSKLNKENVQKGKRLGAKTDAGAYIFRRVLQVPQGVGKVSSLNYNYKHHPP